VLVLALALLLGQAPPAPPTPPEDRYPQAAASSLVVVAGQELWAHAPDAPRAPASLTKIMTALVAVEAGWDGAAWATVSPHAAAETGSRLGLKAGEALTAGDALTAAMVASANDACVVVAEHVAGSEAAFVARMNARAAALGMTATRFENACGHDAPAHRSSARDLLKLTRAALASEEVRRLAQLETATVRTRGGRSLTVRSTNALIGRLPGALGLKSGFTPGAGRCVVAVAERAGVEVVVILLDAGDRWFSAAGLVELAFDEARRRG
jgi:D-alanyl-D-alanine carboxypeptidase (penicillin-binding protein 5/6)